MLGIDLYENNIIINMKWYDYILKLILYDVTWMTSSAEAVAASVGVIFGVFD